MDSVLCIANTAAGDPTQEGMQHALEVLRARIDVELCVTADPGELDSALHRAGSRRVLVAGGDGSLHAVVAALHRRNDLSGRTLALLPFGTGNDFARTVGIPLDPVQAAHVVLEGTPAPMDLLVDELGEVVVNSVHAGASAAASQEGATWKSRLRPFGLGILGYPLGTMISAVNPPFVRLRVEVDGEVVADVDQHVLMCAIGNGASVGGGLEITPLADPGDGAADVMVSFATGPLARFGYVLAMLRGRQQQRSDVLYTRGRQVALSGEDFTLSADGEMVGSERRRCWHVEAGAYSLVVPASG